MTHKGPFRQENESNDSEGGSTGENGPQIHESLSYPVKSADVIVIVTSTSGAIGTVVLIAATLKINDWNLYSSSLSFVNILDAVFGRRVNRAAVTMVVGIICWIS